MKQTISRLEYSALLLKLQPHTETIQKALVEGKTVTNMSQEYCVSVSTMRNLLDALGIEHKRGMAKKHSIEERLTKIEAPLAEIQTLFNEV